MATSKMNYLIKEHTTKKKMVVGLKEFKENKLTLYTKQKKVREQKKILEYLEQAVELELNAASD